MKYDIGDKVRIKSLDWYNKNKDKWGDVPCGEYDFVSNMSVFCGKILTIDVEFEYETYLMKEDTHCFVFTNEMIEGLVEEEIKNWADTSIPDGPYTVTYDSPSINDSMNKNNINNEIILPKGYIFKDENGIVINATKIVLEKKKKEYPKTYEECCKVMGVNHTNDLDICEHCDYKTEITYYEDSLLEKIETLYRLIICRDAYWKIAGDEMGLGKPWEPDWSTENEIKYVIEIYRNNVRKNSQGYSNTTLAFPTEEMRDAFYEAFRKEIEICKELL